jgi:nucleotide-binding universal stress UspA family protein
VVRRFKKILFVAGSNSDDRGVEVLVGDAFLEVVREVLHNDYDLVIKPAEKPGGVEQTLFGNTAEEILKRIDCSVLAIKPPGFISPVSLT